MLNSIILSLLVAWSAQAGKTPMTLEELCQSSDLIAVVQADPSSCSSIVCSDSADADAEPCDESDGTDVESCGVVQSADVTVVTTLKGCAGAQELQLCAPPMSTRIGGLDLHADQPRLVFLQKTADGRFACYSHVGHVRMDGSKLDPYRTAVSEYFQLQTAAVEVREQRLHEWRVNLALDPITRAEGVRVLQAQSLVAKNNPSPLSKAQRDKLIAALCSAPHFGAANQQLYRLLATDSDPRLGDYALAMVRSWNGKIPWNGRYWIQQTVTHLGDDSAQQYFQTHWTQFDSYLGGKDWKFTSDSIAESEALKILLSQLAPAA